MFAIARYLKGKSGRCCNIVVCELNHKVLGLFEEIKQFQSSSSMYPCNLQRTCLI